MTFEINKKKINKIIQISMKAVLLIQIVIKG